MFELSGHVEIARTWSQTGSQLVCDQLGKLIAELLASWIVHDRPTDLLARASETAQFVLVLVFCCIWFSLVYFV